MPPPRRSTLFPYTTLFRSVGETGRGWRSVGEKIFGLQRIVWDGKTVPMEMRTVSLTKTGFRIQFTKPVDRNARSEEHTSELQSQFHLVCRLLLEKKKSRRIRDAQHARPGEVQARPLPVGVDIRGLRVHAGASAAGDLLGKN